jgi:Holliday junction resolvasome RuvABC ATP-dependent DNA helicase subunit
VLTRQDRVCDQRLALEVLEVNGIADDGLTPDMQAMLTFLYTRARHESRDGEVKYQASVNTIATAIGKSRDTKAVALRVEPFLIRLGFVQVGPSGRRLTDAGVERARQLLHGRAAA